MTLTGKQFVNLALDNGFEIDRIASRHYILKKGDITISVPVHAGKALPTGLLNKLLKQAGLK